MKVYQKGDFFIEKTPGAWLGPSFLVYCPIYMKGHSGPVAWQPEISFDSLEKAKFYLDSKGGNL